MFAEIFSNQAMQKAFAKLTPEQLGPMLANIGIEDFKFDELLGDALEASPLQMENARQFALSGRFKGQKLLALVLLEQDAPGLKQASGHALTNGD